MRMLRFSLGMPSDGNISSKHIRWDIEAQTVMAEMVRVKRRDGDYRVYGHDAGDADVREKETGKTK